MNAFEKVYEHEKNSGNVFADSSARRTFLIVMGGIVAFCVFIMLSLDLSIAEFFELFENYILIFLLVLVVFLIGQLLEKSSEKVEKRFEAISEKLGCETKEELNEVLEKMAYINGNIFIDSEYYINFHTGKVAKIEYITDVTKKTVQSHNSTSYIVDIEYMGAKFEHLVYNVKNKRDAVYMPLWVMIESKTDNLKRY